MLKDNNAFDQLIATSKLLRLSIESFSFNNRFLAVIMQKIENHFSLLVFRKVNLTEKKLFCKKARCYHLYFCTIQGIGFFVF